MASKKCVVVLIGSETSQRPWIKHEIRRAWETKKGLLGIYIHNLKCMSAGLCSKGPNPFTNWTVGSQSLASLVSCYDPPALDAYHRIARSLSSWVAIAIDEARSR
jgi:hypothetical protein